MNKLPLFLSFLFIGILIIGAVPLSATATTTSAPSAPTFSGQAADIEQSNVYTWISSLFSTGYTATATIPSGTGTIYYTADLLASASSVAEIQILSMSGQVLSTAKGTGYSVSDTFDFSFSGNSEYEMLLYFNNATSGGSTIATTTNGVLGVSRDGYVYDYSTNTQSTGTVFTLTTNITSSNLQATIYIKELGATPPPSDATVHFFESGLASGTSWSVTYHSVLNGYTSSNTTSSSTNSYVNVTMAIGNTIYYWISDSIGLTPSPSEGIINLVGNMTVSVTFPTPVPSSFSVTFIPSGIPSGVTWGVTLQGETLYNTNLNGQNPDIVFNEPDGSYSYSIYVPSPYIASPSSGTVQVSGSSLSVNIGISQPQVTYYTLSFTESGLPSGDYFTVSTGVGSASGNPTASFIVPNGTYSYTIADVGSYTPSPASGSVTVNGHDVSVSVVFSLPTYQVTFSESGLPSGALWYVNVSGQPPISSSGSTTSISLISGTYSYSVSTGDKLYAPSPSSGTFTVNGGPTTVSITFSAVKYPVVFTESGLPTGTLWYVNITGQSSLSSGSSTITASLENGTYSYTVSTGNKQYSPSTASSSFTVDGSSVSLSIAFTEATYRVTFTESGLPSGNWYVNISGSQSSGPIASSQSSYSVSLPNGSYTFSVSSSNRLYSPSYTSSFTVHGSAITESITFKSVVYAVTFKESGLPAGTLWFINISGAPSLSSSTSSAQTSLPNGSYSYTVSSANRSYTPSQSSGSFTVSGTSLSVSISFTLVTYTVTFTETGLPPDTLWGVVFGTNSSFSTLTSISFGLVTAGTYRYSASSSGYVTVSGNLTVTSSTTKSIAFVSSLVVTGPPSISITSAQDYYINGTLTPPSNYSLSRFSLLTVREAWNSSVAYYNTTPSQDFSIQVKALNTTYQLSFRLLGTNITSQLANTSVEEEAALPSSYIPSSYYFMPATGSVIYSSESVGIIVKGSVVYSSILVYSSAYGISKNITLQSKTLGNGSQSLFYQLNINNFSIGQYNFKYLIIYNGKVETSLTAQYFLEAQNAITLKYVDVYSESSSGLYNVSFNISVTDKNSIPYSPVNLLNVSLGHSWWFLTGRAFVKNGTTRDYFLLTIYNLSKGDYKLNLTAYNRTGNVPYMMFSTSYNFTVPSLPPTVTGGFNWQYAKNWLQQGYNEYYVIGLGAILVIGAIYAYSSGSFTGSRISSSQGTSQQQKSQGINIRIVNSAPKTGKSRRRSK